ncbi:MAG: hypothetical protein NC924_09770 [Candidatus Omnitrophica bacterium]|nr:hypothetical protein [Candidatus Omnitrophota bacterium]
MRVEKIFRNKRISRTPAIIDDADFFRFAKQLRDAWRFLKNRGQFVNFAIFQPGGRRFVIGAETIFSEKRYTESLGATLVRREERKSIELYESKDEHDDGSPPPLITGTQVADCAGAAECQCRQEWHEKSGVFNSKNQAEHNDRR